MVTICQQCGDKGFSNALVYCVECLNFAVHRYCLHQLPKTFEEFVNWACEDCKQIRKLKKQYPFKKPNHIPFDNGENKSPNHVDPVNCKTKSNKKRDATCLDAEKIEEKFQDPPSPQFPEAPTTPVESEVKNTNDSIGSKTEVNENKTSQKPNEANKKPKRKRKSITYRKKKRRKVVSSLAKKEEQGHEERTKADPTEHAELASDSSPMEEESREKKDGFNSVEKNCENEEICVTNTRCMDVVPVGDYPPANGEMPSVPLCIEKRKEEPEIEKERRLVVFTGGREVSQVDNGENYVPLNYLGPAKPVMDPIWRGNFSTANKKYDTDDGFVGHLSSKACPKVWEEANLLPQSLCLKILPKADVWPKSFQLSQPSDENIALYFFPADKSYERVFDQLVEELMRKEVAMRTTVRNAELLIFASMELPVPHWRFQGKYYLWGVFRGKQASQSNLANQLLTTNGGTHKETNLLVL